MAGEQNWSGTYAFEAAILHRPSSIDEVRRIVASARKAHAVGTRHSFNGVADTLGELIDLAGLDPLIVIDRDAKTVTATAGTNYGVLADHLQAQGFALHNMASLPHISLAGAVATGTHGSGDTSKSLGAAVAGLEFVTATGDLVEKRRGDAGFEGMVVSLGALGIITRITLDIEPSYDMRQDAFAGLPWTTALANFYSIMAAADSVSILSKWSGDTVDRVWLKTRLSGSNAGVAAPTLAGAVVTTQTLEFDTEDATHLLTPFGVPGPWHERLPHYKADVAVSPSEQIQSEYMVARNMAVSALTRLRAMGERMDPHLYATEVRTVASDALWLSPTYGHDCVGIHFTWKRNFEAVHALTAEIEEMLLPLGARPHWGKMIHAPAAKLAPLYPHFADFRKLVQDFDPDGKFRNAYLARHIFG
jgi:xylitol oxidase